MLVAAQEEKLVTLAEHFDKLSDHVVEASKFTQAPFNFAQGTPKLC